MLEQLEELLITADMGVDTALRVTANMAEGRMGKKLSGQEIKELLAGNRPHHGAGGAAHADLSQEPAGGAGGRRQRLGQDHDHRQAGQSVQGSRQKRW